MTLAQINELFEKIKSETSLANLFEYKVSITQQLGFMHQKMHSGMHDRSEIITCINTTKSLMEFLEERVNEIKTDAFEQRKATRIANAQQRSSTKELNRLNTKFMIAAKRVLDVETYSKIISLARNLNQNEVEQLGREILSENA